MTITTTTAIGQNVTTIDPRTGRKATGTVKWIGPGRNTVAITLADGFTAYDFTKEG
jgi:hypothetical protein